MRRLKPFHYYEPSTLPEAVEILAEKGGKAYPLAGGTDILVRMKRGDIKPTALVNLKRITGLDRINTESEKGIHIGALALLSTVEHSPVVRANYPVLTQAAGVLGSPSIRNLGTLGGNIGRASPAADTIPALLVLQSRTIVEGPQGKRNVKLDDIFAGPGITTLSPGELITSIFLPEPAPYSAAVYLKLGRREGMECAIVGVAALLTLSGKNGEAKEARIALSAVAPVPLRAKKAEEVLLSGSLTEERIKEAARAAADESLPMTDMRASSDYRKEMVKVLTFRAIRQALTLAQRGEVKN
ncbi:MAG: xanthine dehydrogenase family protein subunit M [Deltaproteobacteria bacterium]|nr:xanthine dehydrogenase family protein subunit M [Deltaproteobacteria bacterium]